MATNWRASPRDCGESTMSTKSIFPKSRENLQLQQIALAHGCAGNLTRWIVMDDLKNLFNSCYEFGINPLPRMRKCFPAFNWEYFELCRARGDMAKDIQHRADMVWHIYQGGFVIATKKNKRVSDDKVYFIDRGDLREEQRESFSTNSVGW